MLPSQRAYIFLWLFGGGGHILKNGMLTKGVIACVPFLEMPPNFISFPLIPIEELLLLLLLLE